jgi:chemosensory pili system protein ChpA (sensor histidine kinase/response regulator)
MLPEPDQESLLSIFLMEAWDTVAAIEEGLDRLGDPAGVAAEAVYPLVVVAHRLRGSSALHGFPRLGELAGAVEQILERLSEAPLAKRRRAVQFLGEVGSFLKRLFDGIGATGREPADAIALFQSRHPEIFAPSAVERTAPAAPPPAAPPLPASGPEEGSERLFRELDRFFAENQDVLGYFGPEADEHLETISSSLLALERGGRNEAELANLFRAVHTLKGAAYTVGCAPVGDLAHLMEDLLAGVREDRIVLGPPVIEAVFAGLDGLRLLLSIAEGQPVYRPGVLERAREAMQSLVAAGPVPSAPAPAGEAPGEGEPAVVGAAGPPVPPPAVPTSREPAAARPRVRVSLDRLDSLMSLVGELVIARTRLEQRLAQLQRLDEQLRFSLKRMSRAVEGFEAEHEYTQLLGGLPAPSENGRGAGAPAPGMEGIAEPRPIAEVFAELEFDRYDDFNILARSVAEISADLVEVQNQSTGLVRTIRDETAQVQRLTARLRNEITRARMVPLQTLFGRIPRQVREAARAAGISVNLEVSGEAVEVDTAILEQIADPLLHLVQNAIVHGLEPEGQRSLQGKPPQGTLRLNAYPQGGFIYLEVADDGRGIDAALLRREAVAQGFLGAPAAAALSDEEALNLIFLPGFSTVPRVTAAAGRGVGLDVVRTNANRLNGEATVETEVGVGTRFTIKLPLTVVIAEALLMRVGGETLAVLMHAVKLILRLRPEEILPSSAGRGETIRAEGQRLDLFRLVPLLELPESAANQPLPVVVLRAGGRSFAVAVDGLLGKEEIVIKPLGPFLEGIGPFAGATVSGEGRVILLLDPARLLEAGLAVPSAAPWARGRAPARVPPGPRRPPDAVRRVLLADDSISVRKFVGQMLERAGFQVVTASDGVEALQILRESPVHALVTDLEMPRLSGFELIENLRRRPDLRELPVVILTTRVGEKHRALAERLGMRHYVTKPVEEERLVRLVASLVASAAKATVGGAMR